MLVYQFTRGYVGCAKDFHLKSVQSNLSKRGQWFEHVWNITHDLKTSCTRSHSMITSWMNVCFKMNQIQKWYPTWHSNMAMKIHDTTIPPTQTTTGVHLQFLRRSLVVEAGGSPLVMTDSLLLKIAMESSWFFPVITWWFSIVILVYQSATICNYLWLVVWNMFTRTGKGHAENSWTILNPCYLLLNTICHVFLREYPFMLATRPGWRFQLDFRP